MNSETLQSQQPILYSLTVRDHLQQIVNKTRESTLLREVQETFSRYGADNTLLVMAFLDECIIYLGEPCFGNQKLEDLRERVDLDFEDFAFQRRMDIPPPLLEEIFEIVCKNFAYNALLHPQLRGALGIRVPFRFQWSHLGVIVALLFSWHTYVAFSADEVEALGNVFAQWGYVFLAAALFGGSFRAFGITKALPVWLLGGVCLLAGTLLVNL